MNTGVSGWQCCLPKPQLTFLVFGATASLGASGLSSGHLREADAVATAPGCRQQARMGLMQAGRWDQPRHRISRPEIPVGHSHTVGTELASECTVRTGNILTPWRTE